VFFINIPQALIFFAQHHLDAGRRCRVILDPKHAHSRIP
jgi:hypothetical protein